MNYEKEFRKYAVHHMGLNGLTVDGYVNHTVENMTRSVIEERPMNFREVDVFSRLMADRIIFMGLPVDDNIANIIRSISETGILALGMTFVIIAAGIDLSVGAVLGLCSVLTAQLLVNEGWSLWSTLPLVVVAGAAAGEGAGSGVGAPPCSAIFSSVIGVGETLGERGSVMRELRGAPGSSAAPAGKGGRGRSARIAPRPVGRRRCTRARWPRASSPATAAPHPPRYVVSGRR